MEPGDIELTLGAETLVVEPSIRNCPNCAETAGYSHEVAITGESSETVAVSVAFRCVSCGETVETDTRTIDAPDLTGDGLPDTDTTKLLEWIETYVEREDRNPTESTCVQQSPFEITEAKRLLEDLIEADRVRRTEEIRATNRITVIEPL